MTDHELNVAVAKAVGLKVRGGEGRNDALRLDQSQTRPRGETRVGRVAESVGYDPIREYADPSGSL